MCNTFYKLEKLLERVDNAQVASFSNLKYIGSSKKRLNNIVKLPFILAKYLSLQDPEDHLNVLRCSLALVVNSKSQQQIPAV